MTNVVHISALSACSPPGFAYFTLSYLERLPLLMLLLPHPMDQKYLPNIFPLLQAEHTCAATSVVLLLGKLKIFNLCYFYKLDRLSTDVTKASLLSCCLSTHETEISVSCFVACSMLSHTSFPSSCFTRHRPVEAYYASGWNSRT